jgi:hypothetical protein
VNKDSLELGELRSLVFTFVEIEVDGVVGKTELLQDESDLPSVGST